MDVCGYGDTYRGGGGRSLPGGGKRGPGSGIIVLTPEVPSVISYQGLLTDPGTGELVADGTYNMHFAIYNAPIDGVQLWQEPIAPAVLPVAVSGGVFTVLLGDVIPLSPNVFDGGDAYLEVEVNGETLSPRQQIAAVPYAMVAQTLSGESLSDLDDRYVNENGAFPAPAYDSGYLAYAQGETKVLDHSIGGDPDDYVVEMRNYPLT